MNFEIKKKIYTCLGQPEWRIMYDMIFRVTCSASTALCGIFEILIPAPHLGLHM